MTFLGIHASVLSWETVGRRGWRGTRKSGNAIRAMWHAMPRGLGLSREPQRQWVNETGRGTPPKIAALRPRLGGGSGM